jgi:hypothetical protein
MLDVSPQVVIRDWKLARAWLTRDLQRRRSRSAHGIGES